MIIFIGADHRGLKLKEELKQFVLDKGYTVTDKGNDHYDEADDYPDFAVAVAKEVAIDPDNRRGIIICGSGVGIDVAANKIPRVRSALANSSDQAFSSRNDVNANVLCLAADFLDGEGAKKILSVWLQTPFSKEERHKRRLRKIAEIESGNQ